MTRYAGWQPMPPGQYRSRGESRLASVLDRAGMHYQYEPRLTLYSQAHRPSPIPGEVWTRPDFYLPKQQAVIEYAGRMDLPDYRLRHSEKIRHYEYNGIRCYELFPQDICRPYWEPRLIDAIRNASPLKPFEVLGNTPAGDWVPQANLDDRVRRMRIDPVYSKPTRYR